MDSRRAYKYTRHICIINKHTPRYAHTHKHINTHRETDFRQTHIHNIAYSLLRYRCDEAIGTRRRRKSKSDRFTRCPGSASITQGHPCVPTTSSLAELEADRSGPTAGGECRTPIMYPPVAPEAVTFRRIPRP